MKINKRWLVLLSVAVMALCLLLRSNVQEISAVSDVAGIAVDPAENGTYRFSFLVTTVDKESAFTVKTKLLQVQAADLRKALRRAGLQSEFTLTLTHGSMVVINGRLLGEDMNKISKMLFTQWQGRMDTVLALTENCAAQSILQTMEGENLRAGLLGEPLRRACRNGDLECVDAFVLSSRILSDSGAPLPLITLLEDGYRICGSVLVQGGDRR